MPEPLASPEPSAAASAASPEPSAASDPASSPEKKVKMISKTMKFYLKFASNFVIEKNMKPGFKKF